MRFQDAQIYEIRFGKFQGKTIGQIGDSAEGLRYLDWCLEQPWLRALDRNAIRSYLESPAVRGELEAAIDRG